MSATIGLARYIGENVPGLTYAASGASNVFVDHLPDAPDEAVSVRSFGGYEADSKLPYDPFNVEVIVRCTVNPQWGIDTSFAVLATIHGLRNVTLPDGTYLAFCIAIQGSPTHIGPDEKGRHEYAITYRGETVGAQRPPIGGDASP